MTHTRNASRRASAAARRAASADADGDDATAGPHEASAAARATSTPVDAEERRASHLARIAGLNGDVHAAMASTDDGSTSSSSCGSDNEGGR